MKHISAIRLIATWMWAALAVCLLTGCAEKSPGKYRVGVSQPSNDYWRQKSNEDLERANMFHENVELDIRCADNDTLRQIADINAFIDEDYDLIILSPHDARSVMPAVRKAREKGIPVVTFDRSIESDDFTAHMEVDNYALGKSVMEYARSVIPGPVMAIEIQGPPDSSPAMRRHNGFADALARSPGDRLLAAAGARWSDSLAYVIADSLLDIFPEANLIYAHTDWMAIGAAKAALAKGRDDIKVMGIDGLPHIGLQAVRDGVLTATFLYPTESERLLKLASDVLEGRPYERINLTPPQPPVDKANAAILMAQDSLLRLETNRIQLLRGKLDESLDHYTTQRLLLYASMVIALLLGAVIFVLCRSVALQRRQRERLLESNEQLREEKAKQKVLYDRLEEATQSKLVFFTNVSHDLRTPLTLVSGPVEQLAKADYLTPRHKSLMEVARRNIHVLRRLIDQILDFRKYENGKTDLILTEVNVGRLVDIWTSDFKEAASRRDIRLTYSMCPEEGAEASIDVEKMERVFFNLMSNAFKHTPDNGSIHVECRQSAEETVISVKDDGTGIASDDLGRIFDRFFQAERDIPTGSGIGLAVTKAFIELHGGAISVQSEPGRGSEFTVTLPVRHDGAAQAPSALPRISRDSVEAELAAAGPQDERGYDNEKPLLLVIDDNRDIRTMIADLMGDDYNIMQAADGRRGVTMAVKYVPDLIICDVMMPVMDGMECVRRLKEEVSTSHIPVMMLTACSLDRQRVEGYESGADAYLPKPFSAEVLAARCRNLLANRRRIRQLYAEGRPAAAPPRDAREARSPGKSAPNDVESEFYNRFAEIAGKRLGDPDLSIEDIASEIGLSQSQLTRKIKAITNYTPVEIIRNLRLRNARTLLRTTEMSVGEIAFASGFTSPAYFSKCYRDTFGHTPSEERTS